MLFNNARRVLSTAREITLTQSLQNIKDSIGGDDLSDSYKFSLLGRSSFNLDLNEISANVDVELLDKSGKAIAGKSRESMKS